MGATTKKYSLNYKKKTEVDRDTFVPRRSPKEMIRCSGCGAFYRHRHWSLTAPAQFSRPDHVHAVFCPACRKIKEGSASGELHLLGVGDSERGEVMRLLRNEAIRARQKNALERIMSLEAVGGGWKVKTTTEKLAQRLGRSLCNARGGKVAYKWSHNNKFVRVVWQMGAPSVS